MKKKCPICKNDITEDLEKNDLCAISGHCYKCCPIGGHCYKCYPCN